MVVISWLKHSLGIVGSINNERFEDHTDMGAGSFIKIIAFSSWKGVDFATSWSHHWPPMELIEISEQDAIHEPVPYDFQN